MLLEADVPESLCRRLVRFVADHLEPDEQGWLLTITVPAGARILAVHTEESTPHPRWRHDNSSAIAQAFAVAASAGAAGAVALPFSQNAPWFADGPFAAEWSFAQAASRLQECANCRGTSRVPLRLRESTGSVCAHCRTDRAGVPWPAEYDRYRHRAH